MKFLDVYRELEQKNEGYMVLVKNGIFFTGIGITAGILVEKMGLRPTCIQEKVCKVGIPVRSLEKYLNKLAGLNIAFVVYDYSKKGFKDENYLNYKQLFRFSGNKLDETCQHLECEMFFFFFLPLSKNFFTNLSKKLAFKNKICYNTSMRKY